MYKDKYVISAFIDSIFLRMENEIKIINLRIDIHDQHRKYMERTQR